MDRAFLVFLLLVSAAFSVGACATYQDARLMQAGAGNIELVRRGKGTPTVVLIHGLGDDMGTWSAVVEKLALQSQVIAFNRPGYGASRWTNKPRDAFSVSSEIQDMLAQAGVSGPIVLVGHSLGGVYAQAFARRFPAQVAGLVLVDTAVPGQLALIRRHMPVQSALLPALMLQEPAHVRREFEDGEVAQASIAKLAPYRSGPVIILSAARGDPLSSAVYLEARRAAMAALVAEYGGVLHSVDCGHFIQRERPQVVIDAVQTVLSQRR